MHTTLNMNTNSKKRKVHVATYGEQTDKTIQVNARRIERTQKDTKTKNMHKVANGGPNAKTIQNHAYSIRNTTNKNRLGTDNPLGDQQLGFPMAPAPP